jgi:glucose-1-phosphate cytidylyltransferase
VEKDDFFCVTYGDGVADIDIKALVAFHHSHGKLATVTAVRPPARFGAMTIDSGMVTSFQEKPQSEGNPINGGFFVLSPKVLDYIDDDMTVWETTPMARLVRDRQLATFVHTGFWHPMDTVRDLAILEGHWASDNAPWKVWK